MTKQNYNKDKVDMDSANLVAKETIANNNAFVTDTDGCSNIADGINAHVMAGNQNIALGINANVAVGEGNIALGHNAHVIGAAGNDNTAIGRGANITTGNQNITFGSNARVTGGAGAANTAIGNGANVIAGERNSVLGNSARVTAGSRNIALGDTAHVEGTHANIAIGNDANVTARFFNTAIGFNARVIDGYQNTTLGAAANVTTGSNNTALGVLAEVTAGSFNTTLGHSARVSGVAAHNNTAIGRGAHVTAGFHNTVLGDQAGVTSTTAEGRSIAIGHLAQVSAGSGSIAIGSTSRVVAGSSAGSIAIGRSASATHTTAVVLAPNTGPITRSTTANNQILLGYSGITPTAFAALSNISDQRDKTDVSELKYDPLNFINALHPKQYRTDFRSDYVRYEEITDAEYEKLDKYTQLHEVSDVQVFGIEGTDIEWIEDEVFANQETADFDVTTLSRERYSETAAGRYITKFISNFAKNGETALEEFKKLKPQQVKAFSTSIDDAEANIEELDLDTDIESLIKETRKTKFLRVFVEPDGTKAGKRYHNGFLAQQVEQAAKDMGFDFAGVKYMAHNKDEDGVPEGDDQYSLQYEQLIAPLVGAVQQLSSKNDALENRNNKLEERLQKLEEALSSR